VDRYAPTALGIFAALVVFGSWMSIVGNPHVVETVLGLVIAVAIFFLVWWKTRKLLRWLVRPRTDH
jgi:protein-S-isoprenylcysteine O-methyltransferase Ste14